MTLVVAPGVEVRARQSRGISNEEILRMACRAIERRQISGECLVDIGCGEGNLYRHVRSPFLRYVGVDAVRYDDFPDQAAFCRFDLDSGRIPLPDKSADVVTAIEVIEHLENPREFMRELVRLVKPGGWVIVTTPNQLSLLSLLTLVVKRRFQAFQDVHYPAHLTALLEIDLRRIAAECDLAEIEIEYSLTGRIPLTARHYPQLLSQCFPRALSENVLVIGKKSERLMVAIIICVLAFGASYWAGRRSLGWGLIALLAVGYFYGILRANLLTTFSHFIFDAGLLGIYASQNWSSTDPKEARRLGTVRLWTGILIAWPFLLVLMPFQPLLVSLVGLRGNVLFIPIILLGSRLAPRDLSQLSIGLAVLNLVALAFAVTEYFTNVTQFYPISPVTQIIYASGDVAGGFLRIPAIFTAAHAYGGMMVGSLPFLIGGWDSSRTRESRLLAVFGIGAALLGILMSATRLNFVLGIAMVCAAVLASRMTAGKRTIFLLLVTAVGLTAISNQRFQRFQSLSDTDAVSERIGGSINRGFFEILVQYPMGNGLGGGGTSIPYFLQGQVKNPIGMENEYARILSEQGVIGLILWLSFIVWFLVRPGCAFANGPWANSRRMAWCLAAFSLGTGWIGTGLLTSIPGTVTMLLSIGWTAIPMPVEASSREPITSKTFQQRYGLVPTT